ncbi:MAG: radical SAM protein, partial [Desulfuromonadaceae bacterium]
MAKRYFLPQDSNLFQGAWNRLRGRKAVSPFPRILQIQTQTGCNAHCQFCPNESTLGKLSTGRMDEDLFRRIIDEAVKHPVERISPYLMNEPLADPRLPDLIRYVADRKAKSTRIKINTNASFLDETMGERLIESGLNSLHVSFHGIRKDTY